MHVNKAITNMIFLSTTTTTIRQTKRITATIMNSNASCVVLVNAWINDGWTDGRPDGGADGGTDGCTDRGLDG